MRRGDGQDATGDTGSRGIGEVTAGPTAFQSPPAPLFPQRSQRIRSRPEKRSEPWRAQAASARDRFSTSLRPARSPGAVRCSPGPALHAPYSRPHPPLRSSRRPARCAPGRREPGGALHSAPSKENATCESNVRRRGPEAQSQADPGESWAARRVSPRAPRRRAVPAGTRRRGRADG